jgi:hypothetical protein
MCTVAFVPTLGGGYLLGHNRDESRKRAIGIPPAVAVRDGVAAVFPRDPDGNGTWIVANDRGVTLCLLNAADPEGRWLGKTPRSRGLLLLDMLAIGSISSAREWLRDRAERLGELRAFHVVVAELAPGGARVARFRSSKRAWEKATGPRVFASSSALPSEAERERVASWGRLLDSGELVDRATLATWLSSHEPERGPLSVCMHRDEAVTVSRTIVEATDHTVVMSYLDGSPCEAPGRENVVRLDRAR